MGPLESFLGPCRSGIFWVRIWSTSGFSVGGGGQHTSETARAGQGREGKRLTDDSCTSPFSRMALMTSSSLLVPNSFSSWPLGALSYAPCAPWLLKERGVR